MSRYNSEIIELVKELRENLAGASLPRTFARLYSHHTRLRADQSGLPSWQVEETVERLNDAMRLLEVAFVERNTGIGNWRDSARRAGAVLEWLSLPQLNPDELPLRLLASGAYQLAGYPALSSGLLNEDAPTDTESHILRFLLKADFPKLLEQLISYWVQRELRVVEESSPPQDAESFSTQLQQQIITETASSLGILCAVMRWGDKSRLEKAISKLSAVANVLLHGYDTYSWLLAKLCVEVASIYVDSSLRYYLDDLSKEISPTGKIALERYIRQSYQRRRTLAWPSQVIGIQHLIEGKSFALCTPTGSGKTTVAELAILQSLFLDVHNQNDTAPLVLYLVPSRALASEVEASLSRVLRDLHDPPINVSGLYGGNDWGPTDAWLTKDVLTVLICTYEKAEALLRFLGPLFLRRVSLVVIDEAHSVQFDGKWSDLRNAESRPLRLEMLGTRLFTYLEQDKRRVIALSAVASNMQNELARWVTGQTDASAAKTSYRSTRQLIGRLEVLPDREFTIYYDLLDGANLQFEKGNQSETPYITNPFVKCPPALKWENKLTSKDGVEKRLRPFLFWAALQLSSLYCKGQYGAVLISVTQYINGYATDFLDMLTSNWSLDEKPVFFISPQETLEKDLWQKCLHSCEDYFTKASNEYKLLEQGIVVHHGKMPGLMARLLVQVVQKRIVHIVLATSTLSEGINLPIETILVPSIRRETNRMTAREFSNLIGRAGRPGNSTEGRSLVLMENERERDNEFSWKANTIRKNYFGLIDDLKSYSQIANKESGAQSPLAKLLDYLKQEWRNISHSDDQTQFLAWLETVAPLQTHDDVQEETGLRAIEAVDSLDSLLLSMITELEQIEHDELSDTQLEEHLQHIWQRSYAYCATGEETNLNETFVKRGRALKTTIYPDATQRRRLYRTSLPPRSGDQLLKLYPTIKERLIVGENYALWSPNDRFTYIETLVRLVRTLPKFGNPNGEGSKRVKKNEVEWEKKLRWWLHPAFGIAPKNPSEVSKWYEFVSSNFVYKFNWALGSIMAIAGDDAHGGLILETSLDDWPIMQLPWIVFWLKELIIWGTLEPVAAYLLAKNIKSTRKEAEEEAIHYYNAYAGQIPDELLNAATIRNWVNMHYDQSRFSPTSRPPDIMKATLLRDFSKATNQLWKVLPVQIDNDIRWFDPAGFPLAMSRKPSVWESDFLHDYDFMLNSTEMTVSTQSYL